MRIGILGAARIAPASLIKPARGNADVEVAAVAARDVGRARDFAGKHHIPTVYGSYDELLADGTLDAVYNPLPNGLHGRWTLAALAAGKHVLCEKPFTANADEARQVAAATNGLVVQEAFHYRYHPLAQRMLDIVAEIGPIRDVSASVCFPLPRSSDIRFQWSLAGGALMDAGCYAVHMVRLLGGDEPEVVSATAKLRGANVDRAMRADLRFPAGHTGRIRCSLWSADVLRIGVRVVGERGEMRVLNPLMPQLYHRVSVRTPTNRRTERVAGRSTYDYQLEAFAAAVLRKAPVPTDPADSIRNMTVIDAIYRTAGLPVREPS